MLSIAYQIIYLFVLPLAIACVAWTVTHEEVFKEIKTFCQRKSKSASSLAARKFFYLFTCEYCFSHYVTIAVLIITEFKLLYHDWRGYVIAFFALVWIANIYMSIFGYIRQSLKVERLEGNLKDQEWKEVRTQR